MYALHTTGILSPGIRLEIERVLYYHIYLFEACERDYEA